MKNDLPGRVSAGLSNLFRRDPFVSFREEMNDLLSRFGMEGERGTMAGAGVPSMDLAETDKQFEVKVDVPGWKPEELNIEMHGNSLVVKGERTESKDEEGKTFHRVERSCGRIQRVVTLPCEVQADKIEATCRDGVLTITIPKAMAAVAHKIPIKS